MIQVLLWKSNSLPHTCGIAFQNPVALCQCYFCSFYFHCGKQASNKFIWKILFLWPQYAW